LVVEGLAAQILLKIIEDLAAVEPAVYLQVQQIFLRAHKQLLLVPAVQLKH
jgi:hypothetical protein